ncbi:hypothetical protein JXB12_00730 [candidate division KSB1 bacterium]|nr:hypothetical protein [candidate division KSB1 bacterium]
MARILWIEDEARDQLIEYLGPLMRDGHTIDIAEDASEGYIRLQESEYDVVICDLLIKAGDDFNMGDKYPGLSLLTRLFDGEHDILIPTKRIMVFTVVNSEEIIKNIRLLGITNIHLKERMEKTMLKKYVDEILLNTRN